MKFKEEVCGNCGLDLTTVEPVRGKDIPMGDEDEMVPHAACPRCHANRVVVAPEPPKAKDISKPKTEKAKAEKAESEPKAS